MSTMSDSPKPGDSVMIREVWDANLESEFAVIRDIVDEFPYVSMDTEFPGIVLRPVGTFLSTSDYHYRTLKANVDLLKLIQLGLTFSDDLGRHRVWQFNFREFNPAEDVAHGDSVELLRRSGIDFRRNANDGVDARRFAELLMSSGIVLNEGVHWVTFHSGYDFGYLLKLLTCRSLPETQAGFFELVRVYFPRVYDVKHLMKFCKSLHGGLNKLAELLEVERIGICHQAGSDSLLTARTFQKLKEAFFGGTAEKYAGVLYGLEVDHGWLRRLTGLETLFWNVDGIEWDKKEDEVLQGICEAYNICEVKKDVLTCNRGFGSCKSACYDDNYPCPNTQCNGYRCDYVSWLYQVWYCKYRC